MICAEGLSLIKEFEGCKLVSYRDAANVLTIGYGYTGPDVRANMRWTQRQADDMLKKRVEEFEDIVSGACKNIPTPNQLAAMVCLTYNIGAENFRKSSVLRLHNAGRFAEAASAFNMWNKAGGRIRAGLTRRRAAEAALYLKPEPGTENIISQSTAVAPDTKDPAAQKITAGQIAVGVGTVATTANAALSSVADVWDTINTRFDPRMAVWGLAIVGVLALGYFVWEAIARQKEGDR